jgi:hypothetical protein
LATKVVPQTGQERWSGIVTPSCEQGQAIQAGHMLAEERSHLHVLPREPYTAALGAPSSSSSMTSA